MHVFILEIWSDFIFFCSYCFCFFLRLPIQQGITESQLKSNAMNKEKPTTFEGVNKGENYIRIVMMSACWIIFPSPFRKAIKTFTGNTMDDRYNQQEEKKKLLNSHKKNKNVCVCVCVRKRGYICKCETYRILWVVIDSYSSLRTFPYISFDYCFCSVLVFNAIFFRCFIFSFRLWSSSWASATSRTINDFSFVRLVICESVEIRTCELL